MKSTPGLLQPTRLAGKDPETGRRRNSKLLLAVRFLCLVDDRADASPDNSADRPRNDQTRGRARGGALFHVVAAASKEGKAQKGGRGGKNRGAGHHRLRLMS